MSAPTSTPRAPASAWRPAALVLFALICAAVVWLSPLRDHLDLTKAQDGIERMRAAGWKGVALFLGMNALGVMVGVPRIVFATAGGAIWGVLGGTAISIAGSLAGSSVTFTLARTVGRPWVESRLRARYRRIDQALALIGEHAFMTCVLLRAAPIVNSFSVNMVLGVSSVRWMPFLAGSAVGFIPQAAIYAWLGTAAQSDPWAKGISAVAFLVALALAGALVVLRVRKARELASSFASSDRASDSSSKSTS